MTTITQPSTTLEDAMLEATTHFEAAVQLADRCRSLAAFLESIDAEYPEASRSAIAAEAGIEDKAAWIEGALAEATEVDAELAELEGLVPEQLVILGRRSIAELTAAKDALAAWRGNA